MAAPHSLEEALRVNNALLNLIGDQFEYILGLLDRMDVGPYGVQGVVATLEFIQHHLAKMGHREPPCDPHLSRN